MSGAGPDKSFFTSKDGVYKTIQLVLSLLVLILCLSSSFWSVEGANAMGAVLAFSLFCSVTITLNWIINFCQLYTVMSFKPEAWKTLEVNYALFCGLLMVSNMCISAIMAKVYSNFSGYSDEPLPANFKGLLTSCAVFSGFAIVFFDVYMYIIHKDKPISTRRLLKQKRQNNAAGRSSTSHSFTRSSRIAPMSMTINLSGPMYIDVTVVQGSIMSANCDAIVNSTNQFDMSGEVGKLLVAQGGQSIADDCSNSPLYSSNNLRITKAGTLPYNFIFHLNVPKDVNSLENALLELFEEADKRGVRLLAMPTVGTGGIGLQAQEVAICIREAIIRFEQTNSNYLQSISIYVFQQAMLATFKQEFPTLRHDVSNTGLPSHWESMEGQLWKRVKLPRISQEYQRVLALFNKTLQIRVSEIERIQNPTLCRQYQAQKIKVTDVLGKRRTIITRELFHGTSAQSCDSICKDNFDRGHSGINGTMYGKGTYFATTAKYSDSYASGNPKHMFLAKVITGEYCQGSKSLTVAPNQPNGSPYDSVVNNMTDPTMFVVFKDTSVYPAYLVIYN